MDEPIETSRFLEMELHWFRPDALEACVDELIDRLAPLWRSVAGEKALLFSTGLGFGVLDAWTGNLDGPIAITHPSYAAWRQQSYRRLAELVSLLTSRAEAAGVGRLRVGFMFTPAMGSASAGMANTGDALYERAVIRFSATHPEASLSGDGTGQLDPLAVLVPDTERYGGFPEGIPAGTTAADYFARQWGSLSQAIGLGAVVLRDAFLGTMLYNRVGPHGIALAPSTDEIDLWTRRAVAIFRAVKDANPDALVAGYTSAVGGVADWRVGCTDIERVVADGAMDILIDQTWGGAWQDFWHDTMIGWSFQQANLLVHRAQVEGGNRQRATPCQHFFLTETWDAWEPWDTLHQVPGKLAWSMWAFSHTTLIGPDGLKRPDGVYISWMNNRFGELISEQDTRWLADHLDAAQRDASEMTQTLGPAAVYHRPAMAAAIEAAAHDNVSDFLDDQIGMLNKYGFGCLAIARVNELDHVDADGVLRQTPLGQDHAPQVGRGPQIYAGRADRIDPALLAKAGAELQGDRLGSGYTSLIELEGEALVRPIYTAAYQPVTARSDRVVARSRRGPVLTQSQDGRHIYWMPQDWWQPGLATVRGSHLGTLAVYPAVVRACHRALERTEGRWWVDPVDEARPICVHLWRNRDAVRVLVGNLETSAFGDARLPRSFRLCINPQALGLGTDGVTLRPLMQESARPADPGPIAPDPIAGTQFLSFRIEIGPEASAVYELG